MGFAPWKLNNTGNQIDRLCCQDCFCQRISDIIRETANKHTDKQCELFFRWLEDGANTVYHGGYDDLKRFTKCDVRQFICKEEKEFSQCTVILISALLHCNHEEASKHNRYVCGQRIIRQAVAFCNQLQVGLTGLEKHLDLPYADFLEMPISFLNNPMPDLMSGTGNKLSAFISIRKAVW